MINWFLSLNLQTQLLIAFLAGVTFDSTIVIIMMVIKNSKINAYQRQLEKESISSYENAAKVKVLESKIQVLEKALENALNNK